MKVALHLGAGDAIICAPIIAKLAYENDEVIIPCWGHNLESVRSFFVEYPNVKVVTVTDGNLPEFADAELKLGVYNPDMPQRPDESFVQWFFRQAGISEEERWKWCPIQEAANKCELEYNPGWPLNEIVLIQFHVGYRLNVTHEKAVNAVPLPGSILRYAKAVEHAPEIHVLDSSFLHLAEALKTNGRLIYHQYARPNSTDNYKFRKQWTILK